MKKVFSKLLSAVLATTMVVSSITAVPVSAASTNFSAAGGWYNTLYAEWSGSAADVASVSYTGATSGTLDPTDIQYLVRDKGNGTVRLDIPGLAAGNNYSVTVTKKNGDTVTGSSIEVYEDDRTGYAHKDAHEADDSKVKAGVGAYKDDGTLKDGAIVVYVNEKNKNTVTVPNMDNSPVGIGNILNYKSTDTGSTGKGAADAMKTLRESDTPVVFRFVGTIEGGDTNTRGSLPANGNINGLTQYDGTGNGGTAGDNGMVARIYKSKNVTFEGIGTDAIIDGWGFQVISQTGYVTESIEFKNLIFKNTPEDAIGLEGTASESASPQTKAWIATPIRYCWVHNCTFYSGYCKNPAESDKAEGDGSLDFKRGYGYTQSYNHYIQNHKTNLIGSSSKSIQYDVTFHHNYYDRVWSRQPLARQANIHIFNSYFKNGDSTSYIISPRAYSYTLSEGNYYDGCKSPIDTPKEGTGWVKSYNDNFAGCTGNNYATIVTDKAKDVGANNPYKSDFDTAGDFPYTYKATDAVQAKADCIAKAGAMKEASEIVMGEVEKTPTISKYPEKTLDLPYSLNFTTPGSSDYWANKLSGVTSLAAGTEYDIGGALLTPSAKISNTATYVKIKDNGFIFALNQSASVTFEAGSSSAYGMQLQDAYGVVQASADGGKSATVTLKAGTYVLKSGNIAKEAYLNSFSAVATGSGETVSYTTQTTTEATTETTTKASGGQTDPTTETTTTSPVISGEGYIWNYTTGENTDNFFTVNANDWSGAEAVSYQGATLTQAVKMESSTTIRFYTDDDGIFRIYTYSAKNPAYININDNEEEVDQNGINEMTIGGGQTVEITKGTASTYVYFMQFIPYDTPQQTTVTEPSSQTTTEAQESSSQTSTEAPVEPTTEESKLVLSVGSQTADLNAAVVVPVSVAEKIAAPLGGYAATIAYDPGLKVESITNGDILNADDVEFLYYAQDGVAMVALTSVANTYNENGSKLFNINFTASAAGTQKVELVSAEVFDAEAIGYGYSFENGTVTVNAAATDIVGDVNGDKNVDKLDAAILLRHIAGVGLLDEASQNYKNGAACAEDTAIADVRDVIWILDYAGQTVVPSYYSFEDSPLVTKDGASGITYVVTTASGQTTDGNTAKASVVDYNGGKALYLEDASSTDTVTATLPLSARSSGKVTYKAVITPVYNGNIPKWTPVQFKDANGNEVLGVRTNDSANYGLRVNGSTTVAGSVAELCKGGEKAEIAVVIDFDNDTAQLTVNNGTPVTVTGVDAASVSKLVFTTATKDRSLYVEEAGIVEGSVTETSTEATSAEQSSETSSEEETTPVEGAVSVPYSINFSNGDAVTKMGSMINLKGSTLDNIEYNINGDYKASNNGYIKVTTTTYFKFTVNQSVKLEVGINNSSDRTLDVVNASGTTAGQITKTSTSVTLPAGTYTVKANGSETEITYISITAA